MAAPAAVVHSRVCLGFRPNNFSGSDPSSRKQGGQDRRRPARRRPLIVMITIMIITLHFTYVPDHLICRANRRQDRRRPARQLQLRQEAALLPGAVMLLLCHDIARRMRMRMRMTTTTTAATTAVGAVAAAAAAAASPRSCATARCCHATM